MATIPPGITVRNAHHTDLRQLVELLTSLFALEPDFPIDPAKQHRGLSLLLNHPERAALFVAAAGKQIIGMVSVQTTLSSAEGKESAILEDLILAPDYRHQGIGRALLAQVERWCRNRHIERLQLVADRENSPALGFYQAAAWQETRLIVLRKSPDPAL
jgi:GNAT superfamily N-acetyltransferase